MQNKSKVICKDNLSVKKAHVFKVFDKQVSCLGSFVLVSIKRYKLKKKNLKAKFFKALVLNNKKTCWRKDGITLKSFTNNIVLILHEKLVGNRVSTYFTKETYEKLYVKKKLHNFFFHIKAMI